MNGAFAQGLLVTALSGFIALGYEILWVRFYSFATGSRSQAFGAMLGTYLLGLALGSLLSRRWHHNAIDGKASWLVLSRLVALSNLASFLVIPIAAWLIAVSPPFQHLPLRTLPLVLGAAALSGTLLPLLCHFTILPDERVGTRTSWLYLASIIGSGAGSLLTGFVLMDLLSLRNIAAVLLGLGLALAVFLAWRARAASLVDGLLWTLASMSICATPWLHHRVFEKIFHRAGYSAAALFVHVVETRHGVITVDNERRVYGGGVYDGVIDTRLKVGSGLVRPYFISAVHPNPSEVLVIGMSGGAWTQILAHNPHVDKVTAVEINPGYLTLIQRYPEVASVLTNGKVSIVIDDGRRWLRRHPESKFDAIVMNTTYHWREFSSALLSREFLEVVRSHLKPDGIAMWNCTGSPRAVKTGLSVFPFTMMVMNNCIGSTSPLAPDRDRWRLVLSQYRIDGQPLFDLATPEGAQALNAAVSFLDNSARNPGGWRWRNRESMERLFGRAEVITDDNLGHEFQASFDELFGGGVLF